MRIRASGLADWFEGEGKTGYGEENRHRTTCLRAGVLLPVCPDSFSQGQHAPLALSPPKRSRDVRSER